MIKKEILEEVKSQIFGEKKDYLKTGFRDVDILLSGVRNSDLIVVGGRPSMGKTSFIISIMLNLLAQNKKCLFFSLEMSVHSIVKRFISQIAKVPCWSIRNSDNIKTYESKIIDGLDKISEFNIEISDEQNKSIEEVKKEIEQEKPDFVFIDYLQLFRHNNKKSRTDEITEIITELKETAKENNCIIFITSQLSRAVEQRYDRRPMLSDLRESGAIEDTADVVMFIYRDDYYNRDNEEKVNNKAEIIVAKNKSGPAGIAELIFRPELQKFEDTCLEYYF